MTFLYIVLAVYIAAVNFYAFRFIKTQRDAYDAGAEDVAKGDGKLIGLPCGHAYISNLLLMIALPVLAVVNCYCFFLAFRSIYLFL